MHMIIRPKTGPNSLKHMVKNGENDASSSRLKRTSSVEVFFRDKHKKTYRNKPNFHVSKFENGKGEKNQIRRNSEEGKSGGQESAPSDCFSLGQMKQNQMEN